LNNDTVIALSLEQFKKVNLKFIEKNYYKELSDSLNSHVLRLNNQLDLVNSRIDLYKELNSNNAIKIDFLEQKEAKNQEVIDYMSKQIAFQNKKRVKDVLIFSGIGISVGVTLVTLLK